LGGQGVVAVRPALAEMLASPDLYRLAEASLIGHDHIERYERIA
jgi:diaminohydroxyphosphoribosylaminopyrimidine deaminase/5-amino-6-(5-phosphoribosylamino)uracil reductase